MNENINDNDIIHQKPTVRSVKGKLNKLGFMISGFIKNSLNTSKERVEILTTDAERIRQKLSNPEISIFDNDILDNFLQEPKD